RPTNLHHIWDDEVVSVQGRDPLVLARAIDASLNAAQKKQAQSGSPRDWALESANIARSAIYADLPRAPVLEMDGRYPRAEAGVARLQLARAGLRLAMLLNRIFS